MIAFEHELGKLASAAFLVSVHFTGSAPFDEKT